MILWKNLTSWSLPSILAWTRGVLPALLRRFVWAPFKRWFSWSFNKYKKLSSTHQLDQSDQLCHPVAHRCPVHRREAILILSRNVGTCFVYECICICICICVFGREIILIVSAPASTRKWMTRLCPRLLALCRGVIPFRVLTSTSAPDFNRYFTTLEWP